MHTKSVSRELTAVLETLMNNPEFGDFALGGGTSLALRFGYRRSEDIDLFVTAPFETEQILQACRRNFTDLEILNRTSASLCLKLAGVKVDFLSHAYPQIEPAETVDNVRLVSIADLAAMKINAVTNRGSKKDFSDLVLLHEKGFELSWSHDCFCKKYGESGRFLALRSLLWFENAEKEPDPQYLNGWTWKYVQERVRRLATELLGIK